MKISDTNLANFYGLTRQTISKYRKSKECYIQNIYNALKEYYEKYNK